MIWWENVQASIATLDHRHIVWKYGHPREQASIYVEYSPKIFDSNLNIAVASYIYWCLPGLRLHVAVTVTFKIQSQQKQSLKLKHTDSHSTFFRIFSQRRTFTTKLTSRKVVNVPHSSNYKFNP
jgi:hypothetical protein